MKDARNRKRRRGLLLLPVLALLVVGVLAWPRGPGEPVYQGKALTQWITEAHDVGIFEQTEETDAAMRAIGTNAVPFLLNEFTRPISRWRGRACAWVNGLSFSRIQLRTDEERVYVAGRGLMLLETNAAPALPVLARYLDDPVRGGFVTHIFSVQGRAALPYLADGLLAEGLASTNAVAITNVLTILQALAHPSVPAREVFAAAFCHPPQNVVPRLVTLSEDSSPLVRQVASQALRQLQTNRLSGTAP